MEELKVTISLSETTFLQLREIFGTPKPTRKKAPSAPAKQTPTKKAYRTYVAMTPEEYNTLQKEHGHTAANAMLDMLDNYKGSSGKTYKSDYRAILSWVVDKYKKANGHGKAEAGFEGKATPKCEKCGVGESVGRYEGGQRLCPACWPNAARNAAHVQNLIGGALKSIPKEGD